MNFINFKEEKRKKNAWKNDDDEESGGYAIGRRIYEKQEIDVRTLLGHAKFV